jgi:hypothetical protein
MTLGELTAHQIGRAIRVKPGVDAQVIDSVRHYGIPDPDVKNGVLRRTSVMLRSNVKAGELNEHIGGSTDQAVLVNG